MSINGTTGEVFGGELKTAPSEIIQVLVDKKLDPKKSRDYQNFSKLMNWCEQATKMSVRTNADSPSQVANAVAFGASGIGLCRTEHMFFEGNRIDAMRQMILADDEKNRRAALKKLLPSNARILQESLKHWKVVLPQFVCLILPCMSSYHMTRHPSAIWPRSLASVLPR